MTKDKIIKKVFNRTRNDRRRSEETIDMFLEGIKDALCKGEKVTITNFATFEITERPERYGRNPQTGERVIYPAVKSVNVRVSRALRDAVNRR